MIKQGHRAKYSVVSQTDDRIVIRDIGEARDMSVTNDAEFVVNDLRRQGLLRSGMTLHYFDSTGRLDGIAWEEEYLGFYAVQASDS